MVKRTHVPFSERKEDMEKIKELTKTLREVVEGMNASPTLKAAYMNSVLNLEKKNEKYGEERVREKLTPEEKEIARNAVKAFRETKGSPSSSEETKISSDSEVKKKKKKDKYV
jgi:hypothetical protein